MNSDSPRRRAGQTPRTTGRFSRPSHTERIGRTGSSTALGSADRRNSFANFARSVSCLLADNREPSSNDRDALVDLVRMSFPEYLAAKESLTAAQRRQRRQVRDLGPRLLGHAGFLADASATADADAVRNGAIDESAHIIYELARIDAQIEELSRRINFLQSQIITWVRRETPASARAVRQALDRA